MVSLGLSPELAAIKFARSLKLPPQFHSIWIRNEWHGEEVRHIIMCMLPRLPRETEAPKIPQSFEGYEVRTVPAAGNVQAPMALATPIGAVDKH
jgi:hypothetical protein